MDQEPPRVPCSEGWEGARWRIPLGERPTIVQIGVGVHGIRALTERYRIEGLWSLHAYGYAAALTINGRVFPIRAGSIGVVPPGQEVEYRYRGRSEHVYVHFALPLLSDGLPIPVMRQASAAAREPGTIAGDGGAEYLRTALSWHAASPRRAEVRLWDLLWQLAEDPERTATPAGHPAVRQALLLIEQRLGEGIRVAEIAREIGVSHSHLTRLFRAATGKTVIAFLQERRVERARHLLAYSDLPVKAVAAQVGIEDLNLFNKTLRRHCGASPRALRSQSQSLASETRYSPPAS